MYAQVLHELRVQKSPYWFNNEEVVRIQELNLEFMEQKDIAEIVSTCFRKPNSGEVGQSMNGDSLLEIISKTYPTVKNTPGTKMYLGRAMRALGYDFTERGHISYYKVIPLKTSA